jgi:hypothetical protein
MTGYEHRRRDLSEPLDNSPSLKGYKRYFLQPPFGAGSEGVIASLISHETDYSYRSNGETQTIDTYDDFMQIQSAGAVQFHWPFDNGHEWNHLKVSEVVNSHEDYIVRNGYGGSYYRGPLFAMDPVPFWTGHNAPDGHDRVTFSVPALNVAVGTKFLRNTMPGKSHANLTQAIAELVIDMPRIPFNGFDHKLFDRRNLPKNIGSEYLNIVFGYKPLVSDILKVCETIVKIDDIVTQYQRDAGPDKTVRRTRKLNPVRTHVQNVISNNIKLGFPFGPNGTYPGEYLFYLKNLPGFYPNHPNGQIGTRGVLTEEISTYEQYWFASRWMYYLAADSQLFGSMHRAAQLAKATLGIRLDLELLWELAPWTWLSDWFVNIGDILSLNAAISTNDQVLQYAYLMHETQVSYKYSHSGVILAEKPTGPISSLITQRKQERVRATPYGFGVNLNGLSPDQIAILAALVAGSSAGFRL